MANLDHKPSGLPVQTTAIQRTLEALCKFIAIVVTVLAILCAIFCILLAGGIAYFDYLEKEAWRNGAATIATIRLVDHYVEENGRWPSSWRDLESVTLRMAPLVSGDDDAEPDQSVGDSEYFRYQDWNWPEASPEFQRRVHIDFNAVPSLIVLMDGQRFVFNAIQPTGSVGEYYDIADDVKALQKTIRQHILKIPDETATK